MDHQCGGGLRQFKSRWSQYQLVPNVLLVSKIMKATLWSQWSWRGAASDHRSAFETNPGSPGLEDPPFPEWFTPEDVHLLHAQVPGRRRLTWAASDRRDWQAAEEKVHGRQEGLQETDRAESGASMGGKVHFIEVRAGRLEERFVMTRRPGGEGMGRIITVFQALVGSLLWGVTVKRGSQFVQFNALCKPGLGLVFARHSRARVIPHSIRRLTKVSNSGCPINCCVNKDGHSHGIIDQITICGGARKTWIKTQLITKVKATPAVYCD